MDIKSQVSSVNNSNNGLLSDTILKRLELFLKEYAIWEKNFNESFVKILAESDEKRKLKKEIEQQQQHMNRSDTMNTLSSSSSTLSLSSINGTMNDGSDISVNDVESDEIFTFLRNACKDTPVIDDNLKFIINDMATNGLLKIEWKFVRPLITIQLFTSTIKFYEQHPNPPLIQNKPGYKFHEYLFRLLNALGNFEHGAPFTLQRLCEIIQNPESQHYTEIGKLLFGLEKLVSVSSISHVNTIDDITQLESMNQSILLSKPFSSRTQTTLTRIVYNNGSEKLADDNDRKIVGRGSISLPSSPYFSQHNNNSIAINDLGEITLSNRNNDDDNKMEVDSS